jgi:hypothetical protein
MFPRLFFTLYKKHKMMKIKLFIIGFLSMSLPLNMAAQTPSTEANPQWFYIQVKGTGMTTVNKVLTNVDGQVLGKALDATSLEALNQQLWRFESQSAGGYLIINKASGERLTVAVDANGARTAALSDDAASRWSFTLSSTSGYKYVKLLNEPQEGTAGEVYLSQTKTSPYSYKLVSQAERNTLNEVFRFVLSEFPVLSTNKSTVWMTIQNPQTTKYLTDAVGSAPGMNFILAASDGSQAQQWKMIGKANGRADFVNRATGNIISTNTTLNKYYYVNYVTDPADSEGWQYSLISGATNQYEVYSTAADGAVSYWNATTDGQNADRYGSGGTANTTYAWQFTWVEEVKSPTAINPPTVAGKFRAYAQDGYIYVPDCTDYRVTTLYGIPVRKNIQLPAGLYIVTADGKSVKVLVK